MTGPEHYREAERLLADAEVPPRDRSKPGWATADELVAMAQVHATLALAAATVEAAGTEPGNRLALRPTPADDFPGGDPAYPGNPWGRALYGEGATS